MLKDEVPHSIMEKYRIKLLLLFGSYADGTNNQNSDLDLAFLSEELLSREYELDLLADLVEYYQKGDLDLVDLRKASPVLKMEVASKGRLIYGTEEEFLGFQLYAAARYADTRFLRLEREKYLKKRLRKL